MRTRKVFVFPNTPIEIVYVHFLSSRMLLTTEYELLIDMAGIPELNRFFLKGYF